MVTIESTQNTIKPLLDQIKASAFINPETTSDEQAMALLISKYFEWDVTSILETSELALEDSNCHSEAAVVAEMREKYTD